MIVQRCLLLINGEHEMSDAHYYIGLISGTSMDGIDCVIADINKQAFRIIASENVSYPTQLQEQLIQLKFNSTIDLENYGQINNEVGHAFAHAANTLIAHAGIEKINIKAIGSHGQTIFHSPPFNQKKGFSLQLGNPHTIARESGITTIADFRNMDMALGGEGAPLAPALHYALFQSTQHDRFIVNVGGIANITYLPASGCASDVIAFDTGPGNVLLDAWIKKHKQYHYDHNGQWAASGQVQQALLNALLTEPYFNCPPPKSTGFEKFNLDWLARMSALKPYAAEDVQATLLQLTVKTISNAINHYTRTNSQVFLCGGGAHNQHFVKELSKQLPTHQVKLIDELGIASDYVEALCFAWLAKNRIEQITVPIHYFTGASHSSLCGVIYS